MSIDAIAPEGDRPVMRITLEHLPLFAVYEAVDLALESSETGVISCRADHIAIDHIFGRTVPAVSRSNGVVHLKPDDSLPRKTIILEIPS